MTPERWQQVTRLYESALEQPPGVRDRFVAEACASDEELRRDVESLLAQDHVVTLIDRNVDEIAAGLLTTAPALAAGVMIGAYRVIELIGAGGMGEVYRAFDTKLERHVAIKTLPDAFVEDTDRLARFSREAHVLASLNHPNVGGIYGFEDGGGVHALVLELIEGPTLADRLVKGKLPVDEALAVARQVAAGLEAAHENGIVHRDLKPANIKLRDDGAVKVLDFGLAKVATPPTEPARSVDITQSPTMLSPAMSVAGVILGTAAYMSPEQAKGRPADKRSDMWAFGCVLFEMLTGKRAFDGEDVSDTIAAVLRDEPDWSALPHGLSSAVTALLNRCLERPRSRRCADASAALFVLTEPQLLETQPRSNQTPASRTRWFLTSAAIGATALVAAALTVLFWHRPEGLPGPVLRLEVPLGPGEQFSAAGRHVLALSPDGTRLAYTANSMLYIRRLDRLGTVPVRGSGDGQFGRNPFFSPDSKWLGFWQNGKLRKISIDGGTPIDLCDADNPNGATWEPDNTILFGQGLRGILRVSSDGGKPTLLIPSRGEIVHGPHLLPGGRAVLFTSVPQNEAATWDDASIVVESLDTHERKILLHGGSDARYLSTGHLLYVSDGTVFAARFDPATLGLGDARTAVLESVARSAAGQTGAAHLTTSDTGMLAYIAGSFIDTTLSSTFVVVDRAGRETPLNAPPQPYVYPRMSPDGTRIAASIRNPPENIWVWDIGRETLTPLTFGPGRRNFPIWSLDGTRIAYGVSNPTLGPSVSRMFWQSAGGAGTPEQLMLGAKTLSATQAQLPASFSPDGRLIFFDPNGASLSIARVDDDRHIETVSEPRASIMRNGVVSRDGRWLAYESDASGRLEVFVRSMKDLRGGRWQVSTEGGSQPAWSRTSDELFYVAPAGELMQVTIGAGDSWTTASAPRTLIRGPYRWSGPSVTGRWYDTTRDGRFLFLKPVRGASATATSPRSIVIAPNWFDELRRLVPIH